MAATTNGDDSPMETVTPPSDETDDSQMNAIGWLVFGVLAIVLLPLLPIVALLWLFDTLRGE